MSGRAVGGSASLGSPTRAQRLRLARLAVGTRLCVRERREILQAWWAMWVEEVRGLEERTNTDTLCLAHLDNCRAK